MRRVAIAIGVIAVIALIVWRSCGSSPSTKSKTTAAKPTAAHTARATEAQVRPDPTKLARASIEGLVTDASKQPIANARVCASGSSNHLDPELLRELACANTDGAGHYKLENMLPATYVI